MSNDSAQALAAKVVTDEDLAKQIDQAKTKEQFADIVAKLGYSCSAVEFKTAFDEMKDNAPAQEDQLKQVGMGLSMVGVDYAFVAVETSSS